MRFDVDSGWSVSELNCWTLGWCRRIAELVLEKTHCMWWQGKNAGDGLL